MPVWMDSHWEGWSSQPRHLCPSRSLAVLQSAQQQGASSWAAKTSLNTCARAWALQMDLMSADWQVSSCMYEAMLSSLPASIGSLEEIFQWDWWHRNSLCASVLWPDEHAQTQWQAWWTLQKLPKRELVADLELLTWSKPWATQWLLLFSWLPQIVAWRRECSISGFCFLIFY